jgi:hypothetical protein
MEVEVTVETRTRSDELVRKELKDRFDRYLLRPHCSESVPHHGMYTVDGKKVTSWNLKSILCKLGSLIAMKLECDGQDFLVTVS